MDYTITRNGDWSLTISTIYKGIRRHRLYIGYTQRDAVNSFGQWIMSLEG